MLPVKVAAVGEPVAARSPRHKSLCTPKRMRRYAVLVLVVVAALYSLQFLYNKCDTRVHMSQILTKTTRILQDNEVEYWLDKGTLLGVHRDRGLIPWEYDVDLGVMNATCDDVSALKPEFEKVGLIAYDRSDEVPHKVKLTYDTENHYFYMSDAHIDVPCIRVYDASDVSTWVDIYWYIELSAEQVAAQRDDVLIPAGYDWNSSLLCFAEGLRGYVDNMCCGGCVPFASVFPLQKLDVPVSDGVELSQLQYVPHNVRQFLEIQYGPDSLSSREIKVSSSLLLAHTADISPGCRSLSL